MVSQLAINTFLAVSLVHILNLVNALQVVCFMSMLNLRFPANAQFFAFSIMQIVNVDILDPDLINPMLGLNFQRDYELINIWQE